MRYNFLPAVTATLLFCVFMLASCSGKSSPTCRDILIALTDTEAKLPAGQLYSLSSPDKDFDILSDTLISALYGNGSVPSVSNEWLDVAVFLSLSQHPCELAVFLCNSHDAATDTARLLCKRLDVIKASEKSNIYADMLSNARITICRNYVLFIISSDSDNSIATAIKMIK